MTKYLLLTLFSLAACYPAAGSIPALQKALTQTQPVADSSTCEYAQPKMLLAVSDIEGELDGFRQLLLANQVIGRGDQWTFGKGHLVVCGDLTDRGAQVPELLDFLRKLETAAKQKGGNLHILLGNHDIMNLQGDYRYLHKKYLGPDGKPTAAYQQLLSRTSQTGAWLRSKNTIEKIGESLFLHAGISKEILDKNWTLAQINAACKAHYDTPPEALPGDIKPLFGKNGPFWYRGYYMPPRDRESLIESTLDFYKAARIVTGHTIVRRNIASYYGGKVVGIDVDAHTGHFVGLLIKGMHSYTVNQKGERKPLQYSSENEDISESDIL